MIGQLLARPRIVAGAFDPRRENYTRESSGQQDHHGLPSAGWGVVSSSSAIAGRLANAVRHDERWDCYVYFMLMRS
jgi:hypothetical protein